MTLSSVYPGAVRLQSISPSLNPMVQYRKQINAIEGELNSSRIMGTRIRIVMALCFCTSALQCYCALPELVNMGTGNCIGTLIWHDFFALPLYSVISGSRSSWISLMCIPFPTICDFRVAVIARYNQRRWSDSVGYYALFWLLYASVMHTVSFSLAMHATGNIWSAP